MSDEQRLIEALAHFESALRSIQSLEETYNQAVFDAPIERMFERLAKYVNEGMAVRYPVSLILRETIADMRESLETHRQLMGANKGKEMIKFRFNPNATGLPHIETAGVHGIVFMLFMNSDAKTNMGEIEVNAIEPEMLKQLQQYGYIEILKDAE